MRSLLPVLLAAAPAGLLPAQCPQCPDTQPAAVTNRFTACGGITMTYTGLPVIGNSSFAVNMVGAGIGAIYVLYSGLPGSHAQFGNPWPSNCIRYLNPATTIEATSGVVPAPGTVSFNVPIPLDASLCGVSLWLQWVTAAPHAASELGEARIGG